MNADLPTTAIGLIAFIASGGGILLWRVIGKFMTYIEIKNKNLERTAEHFTETLSERDKKFDDMLLKHDDRHKEMMDDLVARLESNIIVKGKKR